MLPRAAKGKLARKRCSSSTEPFPICLFLGVAPVPHPMGSVIRAAMDSCASRLATGDRHPARATLPSCVPGTELVHPKGNFL